MGIHVKSLAPCSICLGEFVLKSEIAASVPCGHIFHERCLGKWIHMCRRSASQAACPYCSQQIKRAMKIFLLADVTTRIAGVDSEGVDSCADLDPITILQQEVIRLRETIETLKLQQKNTSVPVRNKPKDLHTANTDKISTTSIQATQIPHPNVKRNVKFRHKGANTINAKPGRVGDSGDP